MLQAQHYNYIYIVSGNCFLNNLREERREVAFIPIELSVLFGLKLMSEVTCLFLKNFLQCSSKVGLVTKILLVFVHLGIISYCLHFQRIVLVGIRFLVTELFFPLRTLNVSSHYLLAYIVFDKMSELFLTVVSLYMIYYFSIAAFYIFFCP